MKKIKILILCGGSSSERDVSVLSGKNIEECLNKNKYLISLVLIDKNNNLKNIHNKKYRLNLFDFLKKEKPNLVFIALHGRDGEDGKIQALCDLLHIPYTGSGVLASALAMNKEMSFRVVSNGIDIPNFLSFQKKDLLNNFSRIEKEVKSKIGYPCISKPNESGSSIGISIIRKNIDLKRSLEKSFEEDKKVIIQKYIKGREFTCAVLGNNNYDLIALPIVEIISKSEFFDRDAKYSGLTTEICPANISNKLENEIKNKAIFAHKVLLCDGLTRTDFIYANNKLYFLEINTIPGATKESLAPKEAKAFGWTYEKFLDKQIELGLKKDR